MPASSRRAGRCNKARTEPTCNISKPGSTNPAGQTQLVSYRHGGKQEHPGKMDEGLLVPGPEHIRHGCPTSLWPVLPVLGASQS